MKKLRKEGGWGPMPQQAIDPLESAYDQNGTFWGGGGVGRGEGESVRVMLTRAEGNACVYGGVPLQWW